ncbi:hypothetical protein EV715DRAFT_288541 [Schizophyllum commune]
MASVEVTDAPSAPVLRLASVLSHGHVNELPVELLGEVFTLVVNDRQSHSWGLMFKAGVSVYEVLALVCRKWRPIIESFSRVPWRFTTIYLGYDCLTSAVSAQSKLEVAKAILKLSGSHQLDVTVDLRVLCPKRPAWLYSVLVQYQRFRSLTIRGDLRDKGEREAFNRLRIDGNPQGKGFCSALTRLSLEYIPRAATAPYISDDYVHLDSFAWARALSDVCLEGPMSSCLVSLHFDPYCPSIHKLVCKDFGIDALSELLRDGGLTNLEELDWDRRPGAMPAGVPDYAEKKLQDVVSSPKPPVTMNHLEKITLRNAAYALESKFFDNVILPKVEEITLDDIELKDNVEGVVKRGPSSESRPTLKIAANYL